MRVQDRINKALLYSEQAYEDPSLSYSSESVYVQMVEGTLWVAFAGTDDFSDFWEDLYIEKKEIDLLQGTIKVHSGFWNSWVQIRDSVLRAVKEYNPKMIQFTGHSKGGAMALCAYIDLPYFLPQYLTKSIPPMVFGCPRVVAESSLKHLNSLPMPLLFQNQGDPVTMLPREYMGFATWGIVKKKNSSWWERIYLLRSMVHKLPVYIKRFGTK
jgi:hypothetical protein